MNEISTATEQSFSLTPAGVKQHVNMIAQLMRDVLEKGEHYGPIPGVKPKEGEKERQVLHKSGAEKLGLMFGFVPTFVVETVEMPNDHRDYRITCRLATRAGDLVAEGVGSCCTKEKKYRWRQGERLCPICHASTIRKSKDGGGWYCWSKIGGCGEKFLAGDKVIEDQDVTRSENPDIADVYNTCLKMGKKRAHVDAMITACAASDIFTQDVDESLEAEQAQRAEASKPVQQEQTQAPKASTVAAAPAATEPEKSSSNATSAAAATSTSEPSKNHISAADTQAKADALAAYGELNTAAYPMMAQALWNSFSDSWQIRRNHLQEALKSVQLGFKSMGQRYWEVLDELMINAGFKKIEQYPKDAKGLIPKELLPSKAMMEVFYNNLTSAGERSYQPAGAAANDNEPPF